MKRVGQKINSVMISLVLILAIVLPHSVGAVLLSTSHFFNSTSVVYDVVLDTEGQCINAGSIDVSFNSEHYTVVSVDITESLFGLWISEPSIDQENGQVLFEGGVLWGYCGDSGEVSLARIILEKKMLEVVSLPNVLINNTSMVLLHDGRGTEAIVTVVADSGNTVD